MTVISLNGGDWGVSGIMGEGKSGNSPSSISSLAGDGGAPKAAEGGLLVDKVEGSTALGRGRFLGRWPLLTILGGRSGLGAQFGVRGTVAKVFTVTISGVVFPPRVTALLVGVSLRAKSNRHEIASISRSCSSTLALKFLTKGDSDLGRTVPLSGLRVLSGRGGAVGSSLPKSG